MKRITAVLFMLCLIAHATLGEYERLLKISEGSERILSHGESIIYPTFRTKSLKLTRVLEHLSVGTSKYSADGVGLSIVPIFNPNEYNNPSISINAEGKNFFELLDLICLKAGKEFHWSLIQGAVVVKPVDSFEAKNPNQKEVAGSHLSGDYIDRLFICPGCEKEKIWKAEDQKWYIEEAKGHMKAKGIRCHDCLMKLKKQKTQPVEDGQ